MSVQQMLLGAVQSGYNLLRSVRFRASASAYLNRTPASAGNRKTWTWSGWVKRGALGAATTLFGTRGASPSDSNTLQFGFNASNQFQLGLETAFFLISTPVYRDPSAWYHLVFSLDTTQATASNRVKVYINGVEITAWATDSRSSISQNADLGININQLHQLSTLLSNSWYFDGYLAEVNFVNAQALTPASFGETNALTGVWQPAAYTGTYGTNGFYLKFTDNSTAAALGTDFSGNSNTWTVNNISVTAGVTYDSMTDVPTLTSATAANYCVMNPLNAFAPATLTEGNLTLSSSTVAWKTALSTIQLPLTGKWYFECTIGSGGVGNGVEIGLISYDQTVYRTYKSTGTKNSNTGGAVAYGSSYGASAVIGVAIDSDAGTIAFYNNNTAQGTAFTDVTSAVPASGWYLAVQANNSSNHAANFGQRPFAYTPPTGFVALNTFNLPTSTIVKGNTVMDATLYTGTLLSNAITNAAAFQPDLVWIKSRSAATDHELTDSVRGVTKSLTSNSTAAEATDAQGLTAFNSGGFTVGTNTTYNNLAATYVAWQWKASGTSSSNTAGTITSTVSVNPTAGFSVVTYTGTGANATVGHGLGVAPKMIIVKNRNSTFTWRVYHASLANTQALYLSATDAATTETTAWNSTTPTSTVFSVGTGSGTNGSTNTYVAYCWSEIDGFSKFGSYTGNGSADGPFVYTGFKPKFILLKNASAAFGWTIWDTTRNTYNVVGEYLVPNASDAAANNNSLDILSNGFKVRDPNAFDNGSGNTIIYAAFAENPLKYSLAR